MFRAALFFFFFCCVCVLLVILANVFPTPPCGVCLVDSSVRTHTHVDKSWTIMMCTQQDRLKRAGRREQRQERREKREESREKREVRREKREVTSEK